MLFNQPLFLAFFAVVFAVHWAIRHHTARKRWLLLASYVFYAAWDWRFLALILLSTAVDFAAALAIAREPNARRRRIWLIASLGANLGILGFFKYFNFFIESAGELLRLVGLPAGSVTLDIVLPVGISFFTFQSMSYTLDVHRGLLRPVRSFPDFAMFVSFFPQLVAGPIVRARAFLPQLEATRRLADVDFRRCLGLFIVGFVKKSCVSDRIALAIDPIFSVPGAYDVGAIYAAVGLYAAQIYCDFSGYTDMAIASAGLLGYRLPKNFDFPYFSRNVAEFWRRWHISLSSWLRDYLYISLGGNRGSKLFTLRNLMITMLLGGLWHGASANFLIWGGLHGVALIVHREFRGRTGSAAAPGGVAGALYTLLTFFWVCLAWTFFRAPTLADALSMCRTMLTFRASGAETLPGLAVAAFFALALIHGCAHRWRDVAAAKLREAPDWGLALAFGAASAVALLFVEPDYSPFIYFQF